jgi:hypothetical protein
MFELNGIKYSNEQLQEAAVKYNMDFDSYLNTMKQKGLTEVDTESVARESAFDALPNYGIGGTIKSGLLFDSGIKIMKDLITDPEERKETVEVLSNVPPEMLRRGMNTFMYDIPNAIRQAYKSIRYDGLYDEEELKYLKTLDPNATYEQPSDGPTGFKSGSSLPYPTGFKTNADRIKYLEGYKSSSAGLAEQKINEKIVKTIKKLELSDKYFRKDIGEGIVKGIKQGDASDLIGGIFNATAATVETVVPAMLTYGISLPFQITAPMITRYNQRKAENIYGKDDPDAVKKLFDNRQEELAVPAVLGLIGSSFEYIGFKGIQNYILNKGAKNTIGKLMLTGNREGFTEIGQSGVDEVNIAVADGKDGLDLAKAFMDGVYSEKGIDAYLNGFVGGTAMSAGGSMINRALRSDKASVKELNGLVNNLAELNVAKNTAINPTAKEAIEVEIKEAEQALKNYITDRRKIADILNEDQKQDLINAINEKDNIASKVESLKNQLNRNEIGANEFNLAIRSLNNQDKRLTEQIETINEAAKQQLLVTGLETAKEEGETVGLEQKLFETKEEYAALFGEKGSKEYNEALKADGHISEDGNTYFVNMERAREAGAIAVGSHELLHGIIGDSFNKLSLEAKRKLNKNFLNLLSKKDKQTVLDRLSSAYGITGDKVFTTEELYTAFSDVIIDGNVKFNEGVFGKVKNAFEEILRQLSSAGYFSKESFLYRKEFGNARQAYNFVKDYSLTIKKTGKLTERAKEFAKEDPGATQEKKSITKDLTDAQKEERIIKIGRKNEFGDDLEGQDGNAMWKSVEGDDAARRIQEEGLLDGLILSQYKKYKTKLDEINVNKDTFLNTTYTELLSHIRNYQPERKNPNGLFGWINPQLSKKSLQAFNVLMKGKEKAPTVDIGQTTKEGEVKVQVAAETDAATKAFETEDISPAAQARKAAEKAKPKVQKESEFRKAIGIETDSKIYNEILDGARKALLRAYEAGTPVRNIQRKLRDEANVYLFKPIKNFLGTKEYVNNLKKFREPIMKVMFTSDLVQLERNVPQDERVFTRFVRKLTSKQEVQDAVNQKLLPPEALNIIDKGTAVNLYEKVDVTENELLSFFDIPAFNPITKQRSGKRGTRKDQLAKYIAGALAYDATMEVAQEPAVMQKRQELADLKGEILAQDNLQTLAAEIGRETNVKFSKSDAVSDINAAMDGNGDFNVYSQIKFSRSHRDAYEKRLIKKRPDLTREQVDKAVQNIFKFVEGKNIPNNKKSKYEKLAMHYTANGYLILPEDGYKVIEAERIADQKKLDPFSFKNPNVLIETYVGEVKATRTDPDKVKTFSNKTQYTNGVTVYDVEDSKQGQRDTRKVIDTHFGKKANPWCLCARDTRIDQQYGNFDNRQEAERFADEWKAKGYKVEMFLLEKQGEYEVYADLIGDKKTELNEAWNNWKNYNREGNGFKIAFHNGRLVSFRDGNNMSWWDRNDSPTDAPIVKGKKTKDGFRPVIQVQPKKPGIEPKILKYEKVVGDNKTGSVIVKNLDGVIISEFNSKNGKLHGRQFEFTEGDFIDITSTSIYENGDRLSDKETRVYKNKKDVVKNVFGRDAIHLDNITSYEITNTYTDYISNLGRETIKVEGTVNQTPNLERYYELQGQKVNIEITLDARKARNIEDIRSGKLQTLKINGKQQDLRLKFSKSAENNVKFTLTTLQERNKLDPYISKKIEEYKDGNNVIAHDFYSKLQEERARGNDVITSYDAAYAQIKKRHDIDFMSMQEFENGVKTYYAKEIRSDAKKYAADFYKSLLKGLEIKERVGIVAEYLINVGRPIRSSMVDYITTNEKLLEQEVSKIFGKDYNKYFKLTPAGKRGFKVEINLDGKLQPLGLYQEITAIKSNPSKYAETIDKQADQARTWLYKLLDSGLDKGRIKAILSLTSYGQRSPIRKLSKLGYYVKGKAKDLVLEHEITSNDILGKIMDHVDGKINRTELNNFLNDAYVHVLPNKINSLIKKYPGHTSNRNGKGYESMPKVLEYVKSLKLQGKTELLNPKPKDRQTIAKAVKKSRSTNNPTQGITVLDFDDTLATTQSLVKFTRPDGTTGTLNAEQYASTYENLLDQGYTFDFSEFNKVVKGKLAPLFNKAMKLQSKFGPKNMFVLTARPPAAQKAIFDFLKANGLNIPLENITGLGNSTAEAKALWMADKVAEGYNDFYFADDALQNVQAVKNMLEQFDVKSKVQQAKVNFSKSMDSEFNKILEDVTGIESKKRFSDAKARKRGEGKGRFRMFIPPSHEDFVGLLYNFIGKGEQGNQHRDFFEKALVKPLNRAYRELNMAKQAIANDYKKLTKQMPDIRKKLIQKTPDGDFTYDDAVRVYLWNKFGFDIPGLTKTDTKKLVDYVNSDGKLKTFADTIGLISKMEKGYTEPGEHWLAGSIKQDLADATGRVGRAKFFTEFIENSNQIFGKLVNGKLTSDNANKIRAAYGDNFVEALEDMLYAVQNGTNRKQGGNKQVNAFLDYLNGSVGATMFFNARSAVLQTLSTVNFINFADNNIFKAAARFADQPQFWSDFSKIFNSDYLKQRRAGVGFDVNGAEIAAAVKKAKNPVKAAIAYILNKGFLPTQMADSFAIALGGSSMYRNRVNTYIKKGLSKSEAETKAFEDFQAVAESTQQSARPDMLSMLQRSALGRMIFAFQNVTSQYARLIKKAGLDLINRRKSPPYTTQVQSDMSNISKIIYYGAIQNFIFYSLQSALFAMSFEDDEDEDKRNEKFFKTKKQRLINGSMDSILRGSGLPGAILSVIKNAVIKYGEQNEKGWGRKLGVISDELLQISPPVGIKIRKLDSFEKTMAFNQKVIPEMDTFDLDNPIWDAYGNLIEGATNIPVARLNRKVENVRSALNSENEWWQRLALGLGWSKWELGIEDKEINEVKKQINRSNKSANPKKFKKIKFK